MVEPVDKILQGLYLPLPDSKELGVRLRSIKHTDELANELLVELFEVTNRAGLH